MSMEKVKQTCVKVFGEDGQTRIVNVHTANEAKQIMAKVLHKFGIDESSADRYCIFVGSSTNGEARALSDQELIEICRSADRPEKERLILRKRHMYPTHEEFKRKGTINAASRRFAPQQEDKPYWQNSSTTSLKYHQRTNSMRSTASTMSQQHSQQSANRRRFFGERPPSEIISSNLQSFFPNHNREVLETAGIKAQRLSMTRRNSSLSRMEPRNYRNSVLPELVSVLGVDLDKFLEEEEEQQQQQRRDESVSDESVSEGSMSGEEVLEQEEPLEEEKDEKQVVSIVETKSDTPLTKTEEPETQPKPLTIADHKKQQLQQKRSSSLNYLNEYKSLKLEESK
jgi:mitogen-activated protein kinase kinase kinase